MAHTTVERLQTKAAAIKKKLAERTKKADAEPARTRQLRKRLKRAQRKRRVLVADAARRTGAKKEGA